MIAHTCSQAVENGAVAVVSEQELVDKEDEELLDFPVILVDDTDEALRRLAKSVYNDASSKMLVVGITGEHTPRSCLEFVSKFGARSLCEA